MNKDMLFYLCNENKAYIEILCHNITQKSKKHLEYIEDIKQLMEKKKQ